MSYSSTTTTSTWRHRRQVRQRVTLALAVLLVLGVGLGAAGIYSGVIGGSPSGTVSSATPTCATTAPTAAPIDPRRVTVNVYNSTKRAGLATKVAAALRQRTFMIGKVANASRKTKVTKSASIRYGAKGSGGAKLVAAQIPGSELVADSRASSIVDLVVGTGFTAMGPPRAALPASTPTSTCAPTPTST